MLGVHAPNCSVTDCGNYIERKLSSMGNTLLVYVEDEQWEFISRIVIEGKGSETERAIILREHPLEFEVCRGNARSGFRLHQRIAKSEASILIEFTINPPRNWWLNHQ